jgi:cytochrome oxidase Cu insertion factor (SCO1/SenC/PrrC family)
MNQSNSIPWTSTALGIWAAFSVGFIACNRSELADRPESSSEPPAKETERADDSTATAAQAPLSQPSLAKDRVLAVLPDFQLTDQEGKWFGSRELYKKAWVANFMFTRCTATCPAQTAKLAELQQRLSRHPAWDDIRLVSFSVDPAFDTPDVLARYAKNAGADAEHWKFLTGSRDAIWQLSKSGFKLAVGEEANTAMPIVHSPMFVLVDPYLRVRGFYDVLSGDGLARLRRDLDIVLRERAPRPAEIVNPPWLEERRQAQLRTVGQFKVFHDFSFTDQIEESGIQFRNRVVDDASRNYKPVHYDHGNGIAIADVDGDRRYDIYFVNQVGGNELWRNLGEGRFENVTERAGVALADRIGVTASFGDTDNDGDPDLFVTTVRGGNVLFENDGNGQFKDIAAESGLNHIGHSSGAVFIDFDRDGLLDLFLTNVGKYTTDERATVTNETVRRHPDTKYHFYVGVLDAFGGHLKPEERNEQSLLYRNMGNNRFVDVSAEVQLADVSWSGDATPVDFNQDQWPDLYVLNMQGHDEYYENVQGKLFRKRSREVFPSTPWGSMGVKAFDYDNDGDMDLFVTDMHSDMSENVPAEREKLKSIMQWPPSYTLADGQDIWGNAFYRNQGDGTFQEVSDQIGAENYWPWGISVGDLNADGFDDVFIASGMNYPFRYGVNSVLLNNRGERFLDSEFILGVEPRPHGLIEPWFELMLDGRDRDHPVAKAMKEQYAATFGKETSGRVVVWSCLGSRSSVMFDLDNDGDLDIVTNDFNSRPMVLISNLAEMNVNLHYLKVKLRGTQSNRDGLGAVVTVRAGSSSYTKVYDGQSGYLSHSLYPLYFGLDQAETVEQVDVIWPSGARQTVSESIEVNSTLEIEEHEPM